MTAPWLGRLWLRFERRRGRTTLAHRDHAGPVVVQRPFYPGDGACHVYMVHPPGGLARGDRIETAVDVRCGGTALLTTPAATKVYRGTAESSVTQCLDVGAGCAMEWLPQETILFGGSRYRARTRIRLAPDCRFSGWDIVTLGRRASGDGYQTGTANLETRIDVGGEPRLIERQAWRRDAHRTEPVLTAAWGLAGLPTLASYYAYPADADVLNRARCIVGKDERAGVTLLEDILVVRTLASDVERTRNLLATVWRALRPMVTGLKPLAPRVWAT